MNTGRGRTARPDEVALMTKLRNRAKARGYRLDTQRAYSITDKRTGRVVAGRDRPLTPGELEAWLVAEEAEQAKTA